MNFVNFNPKFKLRKMIFCFGKLRSSKIIPKMIDAKIFYGEGYVIMFVVFAFVEVENK